jgi:hypothetical protein
MRFERSVRFDDGTTVFFDALSNLRDEDVGDGFVAGIHSYLNQILAHELVRPGTQRRESPIDRFAAVYVYARVGDHGMHDDVS